MKNIHLVSLIGSPGHHLYFLTNMQTKLIIQNSCEYIRIFGLTAYLEREYPSNRNKHIIINQTGKQFNVVDGNKHLVSILLAEPKLTINELLQIKPELIRFWDCGIENCHQRNPYDIFIPNHIDTSSIENVRNGYDCFKNPPEKIKIIPANIPFNSAAFSERDRGRTLEETVKALWQSNSKIVCGSILK